MEIYWTLKDVPELASLPPKERRRVHELCLRQHFLYARPTRRSMLAYAACLTCAILVGVLGGDLLRLLSGKESLWLTVGPTTIGMMLGWGIFSRIAIPSLRPFYGRVIGGES
jgi:hypothetical protein